MQFTRQLKIPKIRKATARSRAAQRSTWVSVVVNLLLTATQIVVGYLRQVPRPDRRWHSLPVGPGGRLCGAAGQSSQPEGRGRRTIPMATSALRLRPLVLGLLLLAVGVGMLWSAFRKLEAPENVPQVHSVALWVACGALVAKGNLVSLHAGGGQAGQVQHVGCQCLARSFRRGVIPGGGLGHCWQPGWLPHLDPIAALIVGFMVTKMGWSSVGAPCTT